MGALLIHPAAVRLLPLQSSAGDKMVGALRLLQVERGVLAGAETAAVEFWSFFLSPRKVQPLFQEASRRRRRSMALSELSGLLSPSTQAHLASFGTSSTGQSNGFAASLIAFQAICLVVFSAHFETANPTNTSPEHEARVRSYYPMYMDVHVMIFAGFGFLMTYLRKYSLSAVSLNFLVAVMSIQWGIIMVTLVHQFGNGIVHAKVIDVTTLINGDFAAGAVLISFGAILGKVTPTQLIWMTFLEIIFYALNEYVLTDYLKVIDAGGSMVIHTFGAFFGLALSLQMGVPADHEQTHNKSRYTSDIFAMIGTLFLWMYWPSFNAAMVPDDGFRQERAVVNTVFSIAASCASAFAATQLLTSVRKFDMVHLQNATLAGGVAIGSSCDLALSPATCIVIGLLAGFVSVCGYEAASPTLEARINLSDSAGILNLHGMPGVIGGLACAFATMTISDEYYGDSLEQMYEARAFRSAFEQGVIQLFATALTLLSAIASGTIVGWLLKSKHFRQQKLKYEDGEWFHLPEDAEDTV